MRLCALSSSHDGDEELTMADSMLDSDAYEWLIACLVDRSIDYLIVCLVEWLMMVDRFIGDIGNDDGT